MEIKLETRDFNRLKYALKIFDAAASNSLNCRISVKSNHLCKRFSLLDLCIIPEFKMHLKINISKSTKSISHRVSTKLIDEFDEINISDR